MAKSLKDMVARDGVEPPTPAFSGLATPVVIRLIPPALTVSIATLSNRLLGQMGQMLGQVLS